MLKISKKGGLIEGTPAAKKSKPEPPKERKENPKPISILKPAAKAKPEKAPKPEKAKIPDIGIPSKLTKAPTVGQLASRAYQKKLLAHFAPSILPGALNSLNRLVQSDDIRAIQQAAKMYDMEPQKSGGINVNVNQSNDNRSATISSGEKSSSFASADEMFRLIAADRERRALGPAPMEFEVIPESTAKSEA